MTQTTRIGGADMKILSNRNGSYLTGTEIADAVLHYGLVLAKKRDVDIVNVPFVGSDGLVRRVELTIGWQADTVAVSDAAPAEELLEVDTILAIYAKAESVGVIHARAFTDEERDQSMLWPAFDREELG
jgi:hypothetical protein